MTSRISMYVGTKLHCEPARPSTEMVPEGLYKSQLQNSVERQTVLAFKIDGTCKTSN